MAKRISPDRDGAKMQSRKHGDKLVCVRHRIDPCTNVRYVTVELVVDAIPIVSRVNEQVTVRIGPSQKTLRADLLAFGARWDNKAKVWRMPRSVARTLRLLRHIVPRSG
ncbi:MAG: hypothetical protein JNN03_07720 [Rubrivivax sp.]|nr:hypothetical protein [Rubrivivax sp.]